MKRIIAAVILTVLLTISAKAQTNVEVYVSVIVDTNMVSNNIRSVRYTYATGSTENITPNTTSGTVYFTSILNDTIPMYTIRLTKSDNFYFIIRGHFYNRLNNIKGYGISDPYFISIDDSIEEWNMNFFIGHKVIQ